MIDYVIIGLYMFSLGVIRVMTYKLSNRKGMLYWLMLMTVVVLAIFLLSFFIFGTKGGFPILFFWMLFIAQTLISNKIVAVMTKRSRIKELEASRNESFKGKIDKFNNAIVLFNNGVTANKYSLSSRIKELESYKMFVEDMDAISSLLEYYYSNRETLNLEFYKDLAEALDDCTSYANDLMSAYLTEEDYDKVLVSFSRFVYVFSEFRIILEIFKARSEVGSNVIQA